MFFFYFSIFFVTYAMRRCFVPNYKILNSRKLLYRFDFMASFKNLQYKSVSFNCFFSKIDDVHNINTRNRLKLNASVTRLHRIHNSFMGQCVRFYNRTPENEKQFSISQFLKNVNKNVRSLCFKGYYIF